MNDATLTSLLDAAAEGDAKATRAFFEALLSSSLFFVDATGRQVQDRPTSGSRSPELHFVKSEDRLILPLFSEEAFVLEWTQQTIKTTSKPFKTILNLIDADVWIHINPNQPIGKELSPWELELLRQGAAAIPEIVAEICEDLETDIEVVESGESEVELKRALIALLEAYRDVREAFLVRIKKPEDKVYQPALGLVLDPMDQSRRSLLKDELIATVTRHGMTEGDLYVLDDLADKQSQNWILFRQTTPFYFRQEELPQKQGFIDRLVAKFKKRTAQ